MPTTRRSTKIDDASADGTLLRGEVLARWQEFVGTGELLRSLETKVGWLRDRVVGWVRGKPQQAERVTVAVESGLETLILEHAETAAERADGLLALGDRRAAPRRGLRPRPRPRLARLPGPGRALGARLAARRAGDGALGGRRQALDRAVPGLRRQRALGRADGRGLRAHRRRHRRRGRASPAAARWSARSCWRRSSATRRSAGSPTAARQDLDERVAELMDAERARFVDGPRRPGHRGGRRRPAARGVPPRRRPAVRRQGTRHDARHGELLVTRAGGGREEARGQALGRGGPHRRPGRGGPLGAGTPRRRAGRRGRRRRRAGRCPAPAVRRPHGRRAGRRDRVGQVLDVQRRHRARARRHRRTPPDHVLDDGVRLGSRRCAGAARLAGRPEAPPGDARQHARRAPRGPRARRAGAARPARPRLDRGRPPRRGRPAGQARGPARVGARPAEVRRRGDPRPLPQAARLAPRHHAGGAQPHRHGAARPGARRWSPTSSGCWPRTVSRPCR